MRSRILKAWLLVTGLALLGGCSALRLAYDNGPTLVWWWLDGYGDFSGAQAQRVKDDIRSWFQWHRKAQLEGYAAWLDSVQPKLLDSVTPAQMCSWADEARRQLEPALQQALATMASWVADLSEAQLAHIAQRYAKANDELRREHLQPDPEKRRAAALQRLQDRFELFYGRLDAAQERLLTQALASSPMDPERWLAEREQRQRQTLRTLRELVASQADRARAIATLRAVLADVERSPDPAYRAYQQRLREFNCALAARVHESSSAAQRQGLRERVQGWRDDLRLLASQAFALPD